MTDASENKQHIVFAVLLGIAGLLIILIFVTIRSQGDARYDAASSAAVTNQAPSIDSIYVTGFGPSNSASSSLYLVENTTIPVYVKGTFTDLNGCDEVDATTGSGNITSTLYRSDVAGGTNCSADNANCMQTLACDTFACDAGGTDTTGSFICTTSLQYFADPTAAGTAYASAYWAATATATDRNIYNAEGFVSGSGVNTNSTDSTEVEPLAAIALGTDASGASIPYGALALNATSTSDVDTGWKNVGNTPISPKTSSAAPMTCTVGSIPIANQHYATSSGVTYASQTALSNSATNVVNTNNCYAKATHGATSVGHIYWKIQMPANGVSGSCTGTNVVNADGC